MADETKEGQIDNRRSRSGTKPPVVEPTPDPVAASGAEESPDNHVYVKLQQGTYRFTPDRWLEVVERAAKKGRGYDPNAVAEKVEEAPEGARKVNASKWREPEYMREWERLRAK